MIEEPHGRIKIEGTVTFPELGTQIIREIAEEIPEKPIPWGWIVATGSLILGLVVCLAMKSEK